MTFGALSRSVSRLAVPFYCIILAMTLGFAFYSYYVLSLASRNFRLAIRNDDFVLFASLILALFLALLFRSTRGYLSFSALILGATAWLMGAYLGLLVGISYLAIVAAIGYSMLGKTTLDNTDRAVLALPVGAAIVILITAGLSLFQLASVEIVLVVVAAAGISAIGRLAWLGRQSIGEAVRHVPRTLPLWQRLSGIVILQLLLALSYKTRGLPDTDSAFYALRGDRYLLFDGSMFSNTGMSMFVHYYPKMTELVSAPLHALGEPTFILFTSAFVLLGCVAIVSLIIARRHVKPNLAMLTALCLVCVPANTWVAQTAKGDILGLYFALTSVYFLLEYLDRRRLVLLLFSGLVYVLAIETKLTFLAFAPAMLLSQAGAFLVAIVRRQDSRVGIFEIALLGLILICAAVLILRTYLLTGYLNVAAEQLVNLQSSLLGFRPRSEWQLLNMERAHQEAIFAAYPPLQLIRQYFFAPDNSTKIWFTWLSFWLPMGLSLLALRSGHIISSIKEERRAAREGFSLAGPFCIGLPLMILGGYFMFIQEYYGGPGDGNYFAFFVLVATTFLYSTVYSHGKILPREEKAILCLHSIALWFLLSLILFANYHPQSPATMGRWGKLTIYKDIVDLELKKFELDKVGELLAAHVNGEDCRALVSVGDLNLSDTERHIRPSVLLPCRVDVLELFNMRGFANFRPIDESADRFRRYVCDTGLDFVIVRKAAPSLRLTTIVGGLLETGGSQVQTDNWTLSILTDFRQKEC